jgi:AcrR family transcriptional regulator
VSHQHASADATAYFAEFVPGRRGEILDAALVVFSEKGYAGGTMRQIAARVGVSEPALYRHYPGKEALFKDVIATAGNHIVSQASALMAKVEPNNLRASLKALVEARRRKGSTVQPMMHTLMMAAPHDPALKETFRGHIARPMAANVRRLIPRVDSSLGIERDEREIEGKVRTFMSLFIGYFMTSMMFPDSEADEAVVDAMLAMMGWDNQIAAR